MLYALKILIFRVLIQVRVVDRKLEKKIPFNLLVNLVDNSNSKVRVLSVVKKIFHIARILIKTDHGKVYSKNAGEKQ